MVTTARRSFIRVVLSVLLLSLSTEPAAMAGNVTVTDVRDLAGFCEAYLQAHTDWFRTAIARIVQENWPDTSGGVLLREERASLEGGQKNDDATKGSGRPMLQGTGRGHPERPLPRLRRAP